MASNEFGTQFFDEIAITQFDGKAWADTRLAPSHTLPLHPASHVLHYSSTCFEGMKAFRSTNGKIAIFRLDDHIKRMQNSAKGLYLPVPDAAQLKSMIIELLDKYRDQVPAFPSSAYIRPTLIGSDTSIGRAAAPSTTAMLFVLLSPVGDYLSLDQRLRVLLNTKDLRCAPHMGAIKTGGNYASAIDLVMQAREQHQVEEVIFAPDGSVQETATANVLLIDDNEVLTSALSTSYLPGITRDSLLKVASKLGYTVNERDISADELIAWCQTGEVALSGTAAVLAPVSDIVYQDSNHVVNAGKVSTNTLKLRKALNDIQHGVARDYFSWLAIV